MLNKVTSDNQINYFVQILRTKYILKPRNNYKAIKYHELHEDAIT